MTQPTLAGFAYTTIRDALIMLDIRPGEPLNDDLLAKQMSIGRTPVREALKQLELDRLVGNLVSNTIIVFVALTVSLKLAIVALVFLVLIHKLEYFLNSKIIGDRIRNPVWLTLIALILGERLMGIPGLILAPVVLNYLRVEMLTVEVRKTPEPLESLNR